MECTTLRDRGRRSSQVDLGLWAPSCCVPSSMADTSVADAANAMIGASIFSGVSGEAALPDTALPSSCFIHDTCWSRETRDERLSEASVAGPFAAKPKERSLTYPSLALAGCASRYVLVLVSRR